MGVLKGLLVMGIIVTVLVGAALVQLAITLLPYLLAALIVVPLLRWRKSRAPTAAAAPRAARVCNDRQPRYRIGAPAAAPGGWLMVPVWVAPKQPDPSVLDAEVITDRD